MSAPRYQVIVTTPDGHQHVSQNTYKPVSKKDAQSISSHLLALREPTPLCPVLSVAVSVVEVVMTATRQ